MITITEDGIIEPFGIILSRETRQQLLPPTRDISEEKEAADGDIDFGTELKAGELILHGIIEFEPEDKYSAKTTLAGQLKDCIDPQQLVFEVNPDMSIFVRLSGKPEIVEYASWIEVTIPFKTEPFWVSPDENTLTGSGTLTNAGTFETPLTIEIAGPVTNPSVVVGSETLSYTGTIESGQTLTINTEYQTAKIGSTNATSGYNGVYPLLQPGSTNVTAVVAGTTLFRWRNRWI